MKKRPLWLYIIGVVIVLAVLNYVSWHIGGDTKLHASALFSGGFLLGLLAMYIAVHLYTWR